MAKNSKLTSAVNKQMYLRGLILAVIDIVLIIASMVGALWVRFDFSFMQIDAEYLEALYKYMPINILCTLLINWLFRLYTSLWRFAGAVEIGNIVLSSVVSTVVQVLGIKLMGLHVPRSYPILYIGLLAVLLTASRFSYRFVRVVLSRRRQDDGQKRISTMIVGAGAAGYTIVGEMKTSKHLFRDIKCMIDDDPAKVGTYLRGVPIVGKKEDIPYFAKKYEIEEIIIAIPTLSAASRSELIDICQTTSCKVLTLPGIYQLVNREVSVSMLREVQIEEMLGREPVKLEMETVMDDISGKVILVTGGGGSIGSEICRQIAMHNPKRLIIVDIYENNAYDIQNELRKKYPELDLVVLIASVRDKGRIDSIFKTYRPGGVFHAAAHKHVPLMEGSPNEAIKNNVLGTWNVAHAADEFGAAKMVLISSDKAVRPTNVMGASKRICEQIIEYFAQRSTTVYAAVRFGNVLGSNGSVIPLFRQQIAEGGPVTVTHPEICRYFMTIPEAVNLVLQCGALAHKGEIFILDMGQPVKILDLAEKMIRLSGLVPGRDIEIKFIGPRPGEKLYEELLLDENNLKATPNEKIFVLYEDVVKPEDLKDRIDRIVSAAYEETDDIRDLILQMVPEYTAAAPTGRLLEEELPEEEAAPQSVG